MFLQVAEQIILEEELSSELLIEENIPSFGKAEVKYKTVKKGKKTMRIVESDKIYRFDSCIQQTL